MLTLTYEYRLEPNQQQIEMIEYTLDVCRSVWNYVLREKKGLAQLSQVDC